MAARTSLRRGSCCSRCWPGTPRSAAHRPWTCSMRWCTTIRRRSSGRQPWRRSIASSRRRSPRRRGIATRPPRKWRPICVPASRAPARLKRRRRGRHGALHPPAIPLPGRGPPHHELPPPTLDAPHARRRPRRPRAHDARVRGGGARGVSVLLVRGRDGAAVSGARRGVSGPRSSLHARAAAESCRARSEERERE